MLWIHFQGDIRPFINLNLNILTGKLKAERMDDDLLSLGHTTQEGLDRLLDDGQTGAFTKEWEQHCANQRLTKLFSSASIPYRGLKITRE